MTEEKAQAGLDFLVTYSWALLLIVLIVGVLFAMGIFDANSFLGSRSAGFGQIRPSAWRITSDGNVTLILKNYAGIPVNVTNMTALIGVLNVTANNTSILIAPGQQSQAFLLGNFSNATMGPGASYSMQLFIQYVDIGTNFTYTDAGTVSGRVG